MYFYKLIYLDRRLSLRLVELKVFSILAVLNPVLSDPLVPVRPSLCGNACHFGIFVKEIDLEPLVAVIFSRGPSATASFSLNIQSGTSGTMVPVPFRRGTELSVGNITLFKAKRLFTFSWFFN